MIKPLSNGAYQLLHEGTLCFADIEANGLHINVDYYKQAKKNMIDIVADLEQKIMQTKEGQMWKQYYGHKLNLNSHPQLGDILFNKLKYTSTKVTEKAKKPATDDQSLSKINTPFTSLYLKRAKLKKAATTYIDAFLREEVNGVIHPFLGLVGVRTYRSQGDHPNLLNIPIRDPEIGKLIRTGIKPSHGNRLVERDYKGIEVSIAASYNHDPVLLHDIIRGDMHRDTAMDCFILKKEQMTKNIRFLGKNEAVFPWFYSDWYKSTARNMYEHIDDKQYSTKQGVLLRAHLASVGIKTYRQFESHLEKVFDRFWNKKYKVYTAWKRQWVKDYWKKGYFDTLTGFRCSAIMDDKQAVNYPIQGSAFHCLLWSLIQLNNWLKKENMKSKIVLQVYDCVLTDEHPSESAIIEKKAKEIMTIDLPRHFPWITAPMLIETEATEIDGNWHDKKEI